MRFYEITSGVRIPVSEEEQALLDLTTDHNRIVRAELDERQQEVARRMVSRGLLRRFRDKTGKIVFEPNNTTDIWRF